MGLTKRNTGADIPSGAEWAIERDGIVIGYARNLEEADNYLANAGNDQASRAFFEKKHGPKMFGQSATEIFGRAVGETMANESPQEAQQHMRRIDRFRSIFDQFLIDRAAVSHGPNILAVSWEEFQTMFREYQDAERTNEHRNFPFQPLSAYARKLCREGKRPIRPILAGECGVWTDRNGQAKIIILKDKGPGDAGGVQVQVPKGPSK